jgi:glycosyltransferase involved in cell wall biosynthesis
LRAAVSSERSAEIFSFLGEHLIHDKRLVVVMPAYNAERTIAQTLAEIPAGFVDEVILVDDASRDKTTEVARSLGLHTIRHEKNRGYGGNQKTCYRAALERGADIVVMLHPDYQYSPRLVVAMASMIAVDQYDVVLGSRILCGSAIAGGMPIYKYISNRLLTIARRSRRFRLRKTMMISYSTTR